MQDIEPVLTTVGRTLKRLRLAQGLSLADLAEGAGVSKSSLSLIERGEGNPSVETLWRIAQGLGQPLGALLAEPSQDPVRIIPRHSGTPVAGASGMRAWLISAEVRAQRSELYDIHLPAGTEHVAEAHPAGATEVVVCVAGTAAVGPDGRQVQLAAGDAAWFAADVPHRYSAGPEGAQVVDLILTP